MGNGVWSKINNMSDGGQVAAVSVLASLQAFWGSNLIYYLIWRYNLFRSYKIQEGMPDSNLIKKELIENILGTATIIPLFSYLAYKLYIKGGKKNQEDENQGWANFRTTGQPPSVLRLIVTVGLAYVFYDTMFYWVHRTLHIPSLYKAIHVTHHKFKIPIGIASSYSQFVESFSQLVMWWIPLGLSGYLTGDLHINSIYWYSVFRWIETVEAHSGYDLPFHPMRLILLPAGSRFHDFHHSHFDGNYGATKIWDWLMGTNKDYFDYLKSKKLST
jgi:sterol desaturase/sphingolipid hydroxylase (fatty acid hydroxylase superfamily)